MTTNNQCNHTLEIAEEMYNIYHSTLSHAPRETGWADEPADVKQAWYHVANQAIPIIATHALNDVKEYLGIKASGASVWWKKALLALASAAGGMLGLSIFQGCGHSVDVTPDRTEICKDGSCLIIEQGHLSYSQAQPATDTPPIVQATKK